MENERPVFDSLSHAAFLTLLVEMLYLDVNEINVTEFLHSKKNVHVPFEQHFAKMLIKKTLPQKVLKIKKRDIILRSYDLRLPKWLVLIEKFFYLGIKLSYS